MKNYIYLTLALILASCMPNTNKSKEINIYSQRHYDSDKMQYKKFEEKTGIKVNVTKAGADELIQRMKNEGDNSQADLYGRERRTSNVAGPVKCGARLGRRGHVCSPSVGFAR